MTHSVLRPGGFMPAITVVAVIRGTPAFTFVRFVAVMGWGSRGPPPQMDAIKQGVGGWGVVVGGGGVGGRAVRAARWAWTSSKQGQGSQPSKPEQAKNSKQSV